MTEPTDQSLAVQLPIAQMLEAHRKERHAIVIHDFPDPDAISSAFAHRVISNAFDIETDILYSGRLSHQQNLALVRLLGIELTRFNPELDLAQYKGAVYVDNQGTTCAAIVQALEAAHVPPLLVVDHHEPQDFLKPEYQDIRRSGATATIYAGYLEKGLVEMDRSRREHTLLATALMHGIISDTASFNRAGDEDFAAAAFLSRFRDAELLQQIMSQARSKQVMTIIQRALGGRSSAEGFSIAGVGFLRAEDRDAIPQVADFLLSEENIHTAIVYGIVKTAEDEEKLIGSLRTLKFTLDPDEFLKEVFGKDGTGKYFGGGKPQAGGFEIPVGFLSGGGDEEFRNMKWQVYDRQISQKLFAKIGMGQSPSGFGTDARSAGGLTPSGRPPADA